MESDDLKSRLITLVLRIKMFFRFFGLLIDSTQNVNDNIYLLFFHRVNSQVILNNDHENDF